MQQKRKVNRMKLAVDNVLEAKKPKHFGRGPDGPAGTGRSREWIYN